MPSTESEIGAKEEVLKDLFSDKYLFEVPDFQRPFAWEKDNFEQLFTDIKESLTANQDNYKDIKEYEPYFLGTSILWTKSKLDDGSGTYAVVDGQQRLVSLSILLAAARDMTTDPNLKDTLQKAVLQKPNEFVGTDESIRVLVRENDREFMKTKVFDEGVTAKIDDVNKSELSESKLHMIEAIEVFRKDFSDQKGEFDQKLISDYMKFLLRKVMMVVVKTDSIGTAFKLFNVINTRGMPLTNADLLKSDNLVAIGEKDRVRYTGIWEGLDEDLGSETMDTITSLIRTIKMKEKARKSIYEEFSDLFKKDPSFKGAVFVDYLKDMSDIYRSKIVEPNIESVTAEDAVYYYNLVSLMRDFLPFNDWAACLLKFRKDHKDDSQLLKFVTKLEDRIVVDWISGLTLSQRLGTIYRIIKLIEDSPSGLAVLDHAIFSDEIIKMKDEFIEGLDDSGLYGRGHGNIPRYVLLRIEMSRKDNLNKKVKYTGAITLEHILPQTPTNSSWLSKFSEASRAKWTNRLGNLVLLNGRKNSEAGNKPYTDKLKDYFAKVSDFGLTNDMKSTPDWDETAVVARHDSLMKEAVRIWIPPSPVSPLPSSTAPPVV